MWKVILCKRSSITLLQIILATRIVVFHILPDRGKSWRSIYIYVYFVEMSFTIYISIDYFATISRKDWLLSNNQITRLRIMIVELFIFDFPLHDSGLIMSKLILTSNSKNYDEYLETFTRTNFEFLLFASSAFSIQLKWSRDQMSFACP